MAPPEKIWAYPREHGHEPTWYSNRLSGGTEFTRADLVDELVKAAEGFNRGGITLFGNEEDVPITFKGKDFKALRAALARIKETT